MNYQHKELACGKWFDFCLVEQLANIGLEVERAISWKEKNREYSLKAVERALELIDLTVSDLKNKKRLKELLRLREALVDYFYSCNQYNFSDQLWHNYFYPFFYAARKGK